MNWKTIGWMIGVFAVLTGALYGWQHHRETLQLRVLERQSMGTPLYAESWSVPPTSWPVASESSCATVPESSEFEFKFGKAMTVADADSDDPGTVPGANEKVTLRNNADWIALKSRMRPGDIVRRWGLSSGAAGGFALFRGPCFLGEVQTWHAFVEPHVPS
ncbi:hypothetical protein [Rhodanobacter sp. L36]|uniref:hypothetical protein n=1 Tax=Rhodanobacter sp. L36 TaxID=1747221 RepID=UPI00131B5713|nr:hypothetical protein [Rhodanobacter sp. L36]